ncbi:shikimate transporter [Streptomyces sp. WMMB 322]|uniref:shikimate transporter n=1 Tax=Streptomyces sp. WMMB 322 TaxID=1286821 RepID=UPI0006E3511C|nr:shikimate transporter [Streptomyces sp. WMMB 322]SCK05203.1 MFS transporter, MHS family, shikimate and dehydroshikimate transport protein [Streptomyces sp. WMMB 322]
MSFTAEHSKPRKQTRAAVGSSIGAVVEWYDFLLYGIVAAIVFNKAFFPGVSPLAGTLAAFATFGIGFVCRPLGGLVFGHFGDKLGRKRMLVWTVLLMGVSTALIGVLPTYGSIGWWAPLLLVILRALQGFAVGGEWGGAALMAVESAPARLKALYSSGVQVGYSVGLILATGAVALMENALGERDFQEWGWRVPFLVSALLVVLALWIRAGVPESEVFQEEVEARQRHKRTKLPVVTALRRHPAAFFQIIGMRLGELVTMYVVTTFALSYATDEHGFDSGLMLNIGLLVGAVGIVTIPAFAWLSDRYGRKPVFLTGAVIGVLGAVPYFLSMESGSAVLLAVTSVLLVNISHDMIVSVQQPLFTELFGAEYRYSGAGVGYQVASAVGGGFTPFIATALVAFGGGNWYWVAAYLAAGCGASALVALTLRGTRSSPAVAAPAADGPTARRTAGRN